LTERLTDSISPAGGGQRGWKETRQRGLGVEGISLTERHTRNSKKIKNNHHIKKNVYFATILNIKKKY